MRLFRFIVSLGITFLLFQLFNNSIATIPPLGKFMNPFTGFWQNNQYLDAIGDTLDVRGLRAPVTVIWDERQVPHIFAENDYDLYFAQGFLTARHRLWQMEFQTHAAAGRISEIIGERAIEYDRLQRRRGMLYAAENAIRKMSADAETQMILQAYANGVNTWIDQLTPATLPFEYKLLDYEPEVWSTLKTALLLKYMAWDLTGRNSEQDLSLIRSVMGEKFVERFYTADLPRTDPVIPAGKPWRFKALETMGEAPFFEPYDITSTREQQPPPDNGSNNWAVSGALTASGYPILANDPHLGLNLPSLWYEVQLSNKDQNVYGVSLPGAPGVIIGFNESIAWGLTNAGSDVMDWYEIEFRDSRYREYQYNDEWIPAQSRREEILVRNAESVFDTIPLTRFGPVVHYGKDKITDEGHPLGLAMRWIAHDPSNELTAFLLLNRADNYKEFISALNHYDAPGQNFVFASSDGDIAIRHNGKFPLRQKNQGKFVQSGRDSTTEWHEWIPRGHLPQISNPWRGYISSANQNPVTNKYPYYLGWDYADYERGARINKRLGQMKSIRIKDMELLQQDNLNIHARAILPSLLKALDTSIMDDTSRMIYELMKEWDYHNRSEDIAPWIFQNWWWTLEDAIWKDELTINGAYRKKPARSITAELLLKKSRSPYYDNRRTEPVETRSDLINASFHATLSNLSRELGPVGESWSLGCARGTDLKHLLSVDGLGRMGLLTSGASGIVNATKKTHGPSWRMVVELGPHITARGIYPGGQSGNPGSPNYDAFVNDWVEGNYYDILFLPGLEEFPMDRLAGSTLLRNFQ